MEIMTTYSKSGRVGQVVTMGGMMHGLFQSVIRPFFSSWSMRDWSGVEWSFSENFFSDELISLTDLGKGRA